MSPPEKKTGGLMLYFKYFLNSVIMQENPLISQFLYFFRCGELISIGLFCLKMQITFLKVYRITIDVYKIVISLSRIFSLVRELVAALAACRYIDNM